MGTACYGSGRCCIGDLFTETVCVGGINIDGQAVGAATAINNADFLNEWFDGVLGLDLRGRSGENPKSIFYFTLFKSSLARTELLLDTTEHRFRTNISQDKVSGHTFLENIKTDLPAPVFTVDLKKGKPGSCDFGFVDESKYIGKITYVPVDSSGGSWAFGVKGYAIGTGSLSSISITVIADTGTDYVILPQSLVDAYYAAIPGAFFDPTENLHAFPCGSTPPSITFDIGTYEAVLPGSFIESVPTKDDPTSMYFQF